MIITANARIRTYEAADAFVLGTKDPVTMPAGDYAVLHVGTKHVSFVHADALARSANDHRPGYYMARAAAESLLIDADRLR